MTDAFVPADVAGERFERLHAVVQRSARRKHEARVGRTEEVLIEGPSKKDAAMTTGRTRQNKLVHFAAGDAAIGSVPRRSWSPKRRRTTSSACEARSRRPARPDGVG